MSASSLQSLAGQSLHVPLELTSPVQAAAALHANDAQIGRLQHAAGLQLDEHCDTTLKEAR